MSSTIKTLFLSLVLPLLSVCQSTCGDSTLFQLGFCLPSRGFSYPNCYQKFPKVNETTPENYTVAFFGDQGLSSDAKAVLNLVSSKEADLVIHAGDFDYDNNPENWDDQINDILGDTFNYVSAVGNHDLNKWEGLEGYQSKIYNRLERTGARCTGSVGLSMFCSFAGLTFFFGGPSLGTSSLILQDSTILTQAIEDGFNQFGGSWRFCVWHFNRHDYQIGSKSNEVGINMYEKCREMGAIIITAHDHSYARTHLLSNFENHTIASTDNNVTISLNETIAFVVGTGGQSIVPCQDDLELNPWWSQALCSTSEPPLEFGALFCSFNYSGLGERTARCWFEEVDGDIRDDFFLESAVDATECCQPDQDSYCFETGSGSLSVPFLRRTCEENATTNCGLELSCQCASGNICFENGCWCTTQECSEVEGKECSTSVSQCIFFSEAGGSSNDLSPLEIALIASGAWVCFVLSVTPFICWFIHHNSSGDSGGVRKRKQ